MLRLQSMCDWVDECNRNTQFFSWREYQFPDDIHAIACDMDRGLFT